MAEKLLDSTQDTLDHRAKVQEFAEAFCNAVMDAVKLAPALAWKAADLFCTEIKRRAACHDESKLHPPEKEKFDFVGTHKHLSGQKYGSPEYQKSLEYLGEALEHHYEMNDHHPQHFKNGTSDMNLMQFVEMWLDWVAACLRNKDGNIMESIKVNKERFSIPEETCAILRATAPMTQESRVPGAYDLVHVVETWAWCMSSFQAGEYEPWDFAVKMGCEPLMGDHLYNILLNTSRIENV